VTVSEQNPFSVPATATDDDPDALRQGSDDARAAEESPAATRPPAADDAADAVSTSSVGRASGRRGGRR
jgi:hypothetical protein